MPADEQRTAIKTRCGRQIVVSHAAIPATQIHWVTVRISSFGTEADDEWISLNPAEATALGAALLTRSTTN